jgi:hypothetical protein
MILITNHIFLLYQFSFTAYVQSVDVVLDYLPLANTQLWDGAR